MIVNIILAFVGVFGAFAALFMFLESSDPAWLCVALILAFGLMRIGRG